MEARTWTIVQFVEDGVVEAVPSTWVQDDKCHWPLLTKDNLKNAIKECKPLNTSWPSYKIEMSRNCTFGKLKLLYKKRAIKTITI